MSRRKMTANAFSVAEMAFLAPWVDMSLFSAASPQRMAAVTAPQARCGQRSQAREGSALALETLALAEPHR